MSEIAINIAAEYMAAIDPEYENSVLKILHAYVAKSVEKRTNAHNG